MVAFIKKCLENKMIRQFVSYVIVGGTATIVEWVLFYIFEHAFSLNYLLNTAISFALATAANWALGRLLTFRNADAGSRTKELVSIYAVSVIGLLANLGLMYLFVQVLGINSMLSKVMATAIVFIWNFLSRKLLIYKV